MRPVDNAAAVQVGLALLLGLLVVTSALLVVGLIVRVTTRVQETERVITQLASRVESERISLAARLRSIRSGLEDGDRAVAELERRLTRQEHA